MNSGDTVSIETPRHKNRRRMSNIIILLLVALVASQSRINAAPAIKTASLKIGWSSSVRQFSWAMLSCELSNPDSKSRVVKIRLLNLLKGYQGMRTIFEDRVTLPPETITAYHSMVMLETSDSYGLELFSDNTKIGKWDSMLVRVTTGNERAITILNDSPTTNFGTFNSIPELKGAFSDLFTARNPIPQQDLLTRSKILVILRPDFAHYQEKTFQAVLNYVRLGGTVIFADPHGAMAASTTPLAQLLPATPLKFRKISRLDALETIAPSFSSFSAPVDFLESTPKPNCAVSLESNGCPVIAWKRFGLGLAGLTAFPLSQKLLNSDKIWRKLLTTVFASQQMENNTTPVLKALDEMTGISSPPVSKARSLVIAYLLILAIPMALGIYFKKNGIAWLAGGAVAVVFSIYILRSAGNIRGKGRENLFVSFVEIRIPGMTSTPLEGYYSVMSPHDRSVAITLSNEQALLSAVPPPDNTTLSIMSKSSGGPLIVERSDGIPAIPNLKLAINAPRQFKASLISPPSPLSATPPPKLTLKKTGLSLEPWSLPSGTSPSAALLLLPHAVLPLNIANGKIYLPTRTRLLGSGAIERPIKEFLEQGWQHSMPAVAVIENNDSPSILFPDGAITHGRKITVFPASFSVPAGELRLDSTWTTIYPGSPSSKLIMEGNSFKSNLIARSDVSYLVRFDLPTVFSSLKPTKIVLDFSYANQGGNVEITPLLASVVQTSNGPTIVKTWTGKKSSDGKVVFENLANFMSAPGQGYVLLKLSLKNSALPDTSISANAWSVEKFGLSVYGEMSNIMAKGFSL